MFALAFHSRLLPALSAAAVGLVICVRYAPDLRIHSRNPFGGASSGWGRECGRWIAALLLAGQNYVGVGIVDLAHLTLSPGVFGASVIQGYLTSAQAAIALPALLLPSPWRDGQENGALRVLVIIWGAAWIVHVTTVALLLHVLADAMGAVTLLDLMGFNIRDVGAEALAGALRVNATVTSLNLWGNYIGAVGAEALAGALSVNATVTRLDLSGNGLSDKSKSVVRQAWRHGSGGLRL